MIGNESGKEGYLRVVVVGVVPEGPVLQGHTRGVGHMQGRTTRTLTIHTQRRGGNDQIKPAHTD
jgi:hypothetical protein